MAKTQMGEYSPRMQRILEGVYRIRGADAKMDKAVSFFEELSKSKGVQIFYFGGFLRDAYLGFAPRDLDLVVNSSWENFESLTHPFVVRKNRFGGLKLNVHGVDVDAWSVNRTDSFAREVVRPDSINHLPETTVFNAESIALEVWAPDGNYWGFERGFFDGCDRETLEIQNIWNHDFQERFAALQLGRVYHLNSKIGWKAGPRLKRYLQNHIQDTSLREIKQFYESHYGEECNPDQLIKYLKSLTANG